MNVTWVHRGHAPAGTTTHLSDAVLATRWLDGDPFAWVAGETLSIKPIRRWLREHRGLSPDRVEVTGYWRRTEVEELEGTGGLPDPDSEVDAIDRMHELVDPLPSRAIRVAATLGIVPLVRQGFTTAAQVAARSGADPVGIAKLMRYLATIDLLAVADELFEVTELGSILDDEEVVEELDLEHPVGGLIRVFDGLLTAVRNGSSVAPAELGGTADQLADASAQTAEAFEDAAATELEWLRPAFARDYAFGEDETITAAGAGVSMLVADALNTARAPHLTLMVRPSRALAAVAALPENARPKVKVHPGAVTEDWPPADTVLLGGALVTLPDDEAIELLRRAHDAVLPGGRMLIVEHLLVEDEIDDHDASEDLQLFCLHGSGFRTRDEVLALIARAELSVDHERVIGWGEPVFEIRGA